MTSASLPARPDRTHAAARNFVLYSKVPREGSPVALLTPLSSLYYSVVCSQEPTRRRFGKEAKDVRGYRLVSESSTRLAALRAIGASASAPAVSSMFSTNGALGTPRRLPRT